MRAKKKCIFLLVAIFSMLTMAACSEQSSDDKEGADYPTKTINGVIPYAEGGGTDIVSRAFGEALDDNLDESVVMDNQPGGTGAKGTQQVESMPEDGYNLLFGPETPNLFRTTGISDLSYNDFEPIMLLAKNVPVVVAKPDAKWDDISELLDDVKKNPDTIKMMTTGKTGISGVVTSMLDADFQEVSYDGAGPGIAALLGGNVDVASVGLSTASDYIESDELKVLGVISDEKLEDHPDWPALGEEEPQFEEYLPYYSYFGVYVKKGTPDEVVEKLKDKSEEAFESDEFQKLLEDRGYLPMGYTGDEALDFQKDWESRINWLLYDTGNAKESPEKFDIPKPD